MVKGKGIDVFRCLAFASKIATRTHLLVILNLLALDLDTSCNAGM